MGLVVEPRPADAHGRRVFDDPLLRRVPVEARQRRQATADGSRGSAELLEFAGVELDVCSGHFEQREAVFVAPAVEHAQVERVGLPGPAGEPGQVAASVRTSGEVSWGS